MKHWLFVCFWLWSNTVLASVLSTAATNLQPGHWTCVNGASGCATTSNIGTSGLLSDPNGGGYTLEYANKMVYDQAGQALYFFGGAHGSVTTNGYTTLVKYNIATDQWSVLADVVQNVEVTTYCPLAFPCLSNWLTQPKANGHTYQDQAFVPSAAGRSAKWYGTASQAENGSGDPNPLQMWLLSYDPASPGSPYTMVRRTDMPVNFYSLSFEYFPDIDRILILGLGSYFFYNPSADTYTVPQQIGYPAGVQPYDQVSCYSPRDHVIYFGGGHATVSSTNVFYRTMWKIDASGTKTQIADAPLSLHGYNAAFQGGVFACDPTSGHLLYWGYSEVSPFTPHTWEYNQSSNSWTQASITIDPPWFSTTQATSVGDLSSVEVALPDLGVIAVLHYESSGNGGPKLYLYKHASDFDVRCGGPGVIRCFSFDTSADLGSVGYGNNVGIFNSSGYPNTSPNVPVIDNSVFVDGTGSLRFDVPSQTNSGGSGQWYANFSSTLATQFGPNSDFYIQWRERHSSTHLNTSYTGITTTDGTLTLSNSTVGTGRTATITGGSVTFTGQVGKNIYVDPLNLANGLATITAVTDPTHATVNITTAFTSTSYAAGTWFAGFSISGGFKQISVGTGDQTGCTPSTTTNCYTSCNDLDIPTQNIDQEGFLQSYTSCNPLQWAPSGTITPAATSGSGVTFTASIANFDSNYVGWQIYEPATGAVATITSITNSTHVVANIVTGNFSTTGPITNWIIFVKGSYTHFNQNFTNPLYGGAADIAFQDRASPYCSYLGTHDTPPRTFPPTGNCFGYFPNEWITYTMHVHVGNYVFGTNTQALVNSHYTLRAARFGQTSTIVVDQPVILNGGPQTSNERYGKVWLLPYQTNKDPSQITNNAQVWYDSLIISTQDIPDPSGGGGGGGPTGNPVVVHIGSGKTVRVGNGQIFRSGLN